MMNQSCTCVTHLSFFLVSACPPSVSDASGAKEHKKFIFPVTKVPRNSSAGVLQDSANSANCRQNSGKTKVNLRLTLVQRAKRKIVGNLRILFAENAISFRRLAALQLKFAKQPSDSNRMLPANQCRWSMTATSSIPLRFLQLSDVPSVYCTRSVGSNMSAAQPCNA